MTRDGGLFGLSASAASVAVSADVAGVVSWMGDVSGVVASSSVGVVARVDPVVRSLQCWLYSRLRMLRVRRRCGGCHGRREMSLKPSRAREGKEMEEHHDGTEPNCDAWLELIVTEKMR